VRGFRRSVRRGSRKSSGMADNSNENPLIGYEFCATGG
jgi:hypothetical protein